MTPDDLNAFLDLLPKDLNLEKQKKRNEKPSSSSQANTVAQGREVISALIEEDDEDFDEVEEMDRDDVEMNPQEKMDRSDAGLTNAWQYKQSVQRERMGQTNLSSQKSKTERSDKVFCHSFDLNGKMQDQLAQRFADNQLIQIVDCSCSDYPGKFCGDSRPHAISFYQRCLTHIETQLERHSDQVIRLVLLNAPVPIVALALPLLLTTIRSRSLPVVFLLTIRPWAIRSSDRHSLTSLRRTSDAIFVCEGFASNTAPPPPEFSDLAGILSIKKLAMQSVGVGHFSDSTTKTRPPSNRYGMKRDRRKVHVRMLHLPPEDFSKGGSSVGGGGVRSGAGRADGKEVKVSRKTVLEPGMSCASGGSGKSGPSLDF